MTPREWAGRDEATVLAKILGVTLVIVTDRIGDVVQCNQGCQLTIYIAYHAAAKHYTAIVGPGLPPAHALNAR